MFTDETRTLTQANVGIRALRYVGIVLDAQGSVIWSITLIVAYMAFTTLVAVTDLFNITGCDERKQIVFF